MKEQYSGKWIVKKSFEQLSLGDEFRSVIRLQNPREVDEFRFTFYPAKGASFEIETIGFDLIEGAYIEWITPEMNDIEDVNIRALLRSICSDPSSCDRFLLERLYDHCPLQPNVWRYLVGHSPVSTHIVQLAKISSASSAFN